MDYQSIVEGIKIEDIKKLLLRLGVKEIIDKGDYLITNTICHNEDPEVASMKLYYYDNHKVFVCYSNCQTMSIFKFMKHYYETRGIEYDWVSDIYNVILDCSSFNPHEGFAVQKYTSLKDKFQTNKKEVQLNEYNHGALDVFVKAYPDEWLRDGISKAAMDKFDIRYSISQNKIIMPHYDAGGRLVGIRGRALDEWEIENIGKYMPVKIEQTWYKHPLGMNLYGLYENKENIRKTGVCYVFESEKSVMQCESFSQPNCAVAVCGSQFNKYQLNMLLREARPREIVICFDREEIEGEDKYFYKLWSICDKYKNYCNFSFVYDRLGLLDMKDSPSDKGEETFRKLLEKRTKVK